jgi:hypothetical protein
VTRKCYAQSDIFSFGCVFYEMLTAKPIQKVKSLVNVGAPIVIPNNLEPEYRPLLEQCLQVSSQIRPTARAVLASEWFQTMSLRILTYLDMLIAKEPKQKFGFFKGLSQAIHGFSPLMIKAKILPILVQECRAEIRFAPVLLGTIFDVADEVFNKIGFLTAVSDPPEVVIALLQSIPLIIEKTDPSLHNDCVYPIVFNALQSTNELIQRECLSKLPFIIDRIQPGIIRTSLLPRLVELGAKATDPRNAASAVVSVARCLKRVDHDAFLQDTMPKIAQMWRAHASPTVAEPMLELIEAVEGNAKLIMAQVLPLAASVTATQGCPAYVQKHLCVWVINFLEKYKLDYHLDRTMPRPHYTVASKPAAPVVSSPTKSTAAEGGGGTSNPFGFDLPPAPVSTTSAGIELPPVTPTPPAARVPTTGFQPQFQTGQYQPSMKQFSPPPNHFQGPGFGGQFQSGGFPGQNTGQFQSGGGFWRAAKCGAISRRWFRRAISRRWIWWTGSWISGSRESGTVPGWGIRGEEDFHPLPVNTGMMGSTHERHFLQRDQVRRGNSEHRRDRRHWLSRHPDKDAKTICWTYLIWKLWTGDQHCVIFTGERRTVCCCRHEVGSVAVEVRGLALLAVEPV